MTFLVDANVLVYAVTEDPRREPSLELLEAIAGGDADGRCSPAVLEELWHLEVSGLAGDLTGQTRHAAEIFSPLLPVTEEVFLVALSLHADEAGTNDRIHVATCIVNGIETVVSADQDFDGFAEIERVDPLGEDAIERLISGPD